jgi:hypothetical protein
VITAVLQQPAIVSNGSSAWVRWGGCGRLNNHWDWSHLQLFYSYIVIEFYNNMLEQNRALISGGRAHSFNESKNRI